MPDTLVPLVRRPVRRTSTTTETKTDVNSEPRKLSIGGESNTRTSPDRPDPSRLRRTWVPHKEKDISPREEKKPLIRESKPFKKEEILPPPVSPTYEVPSFSTGGFPHVNKTNLPPLPVAKNRVQKTQVSNFFKDFEPDDNVSENTARRKLVNSIGINRSLYLVLKGKCTD